MLRAVTRCVAAEASATAAGARNRHIVARVSSGDKTTGAAGLFICSIRWRGRREAIMFNQHTDTRTWRLLSGSGVLIILAVTMLLVTGCQSGTKTPAAGTDAAGIQAVDTITVNGEGKVSVTPDEAK